MEKKFTFKNLPVSPKKLRFLLPKTKKLLAIEALDYLLYMPKKGAKILRKAIQSALESTKSSLKIDDRQLKFKTLAVDEGIKLKRFRAGGRGTVKPIVRRFSHLTIVLTDEDKNRLKRDNKKESSPITKKKSTTKKLIKPKNEEKVSKSKKATLKINKK